VSQTNGNFVVSSHNLSGLLDTVSSFCIVILKFARACQILHVSDSYSRLNKLSVTGVSFVEFDMLVLSTDCSAVCTVKCFCVTVTVVLIISCKLKIRVLFLIALASYVLPGHMFT